MHNFGASMFWYWLMYIVVTIIGILHTVFNIYVLKMKPMDEHSMAEAYERTKPFHPFYIIVLFSIAGWFYMRSFATPSWPEAFITGGLWAGITIVFDFCLGHHKTFLESFGKRILYRLSALDYADLVAKFLGPCVANVRMPR